VVWENVPGVLSSNSGRDFGSILGALEQLGYGWAYRVLDAQYFGVPQRRRRVFVIGCLGDFRRAAAVLFERHSLQGHPAPQREAGQAVAGTFKACAGSGGLGSDFDCDGGLIPFDTTQITSLENRSQQRAGDPMHPLAAGAHAPAIAYHTTGAGFWREGSGTLRAREQDSHENLVTHTLRGEGWDASEDGTGRGTPLVAAYVNDSYSNATWRATDQAWPITTSEDRTRAAPIVTFDVRGGLAPHGAAYETATVSTLRSSDHKEPQLVRRGTVVRRLTPTECERLQGFPDGYTNIPWRTWQEATRKGISYETLLANRGMTLRGPSREECPDGPRYKAIGNSMAVPVMRWIGERIQAVAQ
jgi:DNA (cytosine-5)-methyltransferase 1